jgi:hypothetical protein
MTSSPAILSCRSWYREALFSSVFSHQSCRHSFHWLNSRIRTKRRPSVQPTHAALSAVNSRQGPLRPPSRTQCPVLSVLLKLCYLPSHPAAPEGLLAWWTVHPSSCHGPTPFLPACDGPLLVFTHRDRDPSGQGIRCTSNQHKFDQNTIHALPSTGLSLPGGQVLLDHDISQPHLIS